MSVQPSRVAEIFGEWNRLCNSSEAADTSLFDNSVELRNANSIVVIVGSQPKNNLRTLGLVHYMFAPEEKPENFAVLLSRPSKDANLEQCSVTVYTLGASFKPAPDATASLPIIRFLSGEADKSDFISALNEAGSQDKKIIFSDRDIDSELEGGAFSKSLITALKSGAVGVVNGHQMLGALLYVKDAEGVKSVRKASAISLALFNKWLLSEVAQQVSSITKGKCSRLAEQCDAKLNAPQTLPGLETMSDHRSYASWVFPTILPQGSFNESIAQAKTPEVEIPTTSMVVRLCARYREQYAYVARTIFFDTENLPKNAKEAYNFALEVEAAAASLLQPGKTLKTIFQEINAAAALLNANLASLLMPEFGFLCGPVVMEKRTKITADGEVSVRSGMTFALRIVLRGIKIGDTEETFDIEIADSIFVGDNVAKRLPRAFEECLLAVDGEIGTNGSVRIQTRSNRTGIVPVGEEDRLRELQGKIWELKQSTHSGRGATALDDTELLFAAGRLAHNQLQSYPSANAVPSNIAGLKQATVFVDVSRQTAWLPMDETHVAPFHVSTINKVDVKAEGASGYSLSVAFASTQEANIPFKNNRNKIFIKELSYQSDKSQEFDLFCRSFADVKKKIKDDDTNRKLQQGALPTDRRGIRGDNVAVLKDVEFRPAPVTGRGRCRGNLEAFENGFVFRMLGTSVEILYEDIKLLICQPCKNDTATILHLFLHRPILLGRKSTTDVQLVAEVLEASESVNAGRGMKYAQELQQEMQERQRVDITNRQFLSFASSVQPRIGKDKVTVPKDTVDFEGNFGKGSMRFRGSNQGLWAISEAPYFSLRLDDFELVVLERVIVGGGNFDLAFVPHNYKAAVTVSNISMSELISVKTWLCGANMPYLESTLNLNYTQLFKTIRLDENWEPFGEGGWKTCVEESDGEEEDEEDSSWHESEEDEEDESAEEDDSDWATESSSAATESSGSAVSWDEMERQAEESDEDYSSEESRPAKKKGPRVEVRRR